MSNPLPDGSHDAFVVDLVEETTGDGRALHHLELTIIGGDYKGMVVQVATDGSFGPIEDVIGMPATLTVSDGAPSVTIDR